MNEEEIFEWAKKNNLVDSDLFTKVTKVGEIDEGEVFSLDSDEKNDEPLIIGLPIFIIVNGDKIKSVYGEEAYKVEEDTILGAVGRLSIDPREVEILPGVERVIPISKPYKMASREYKKENTVVEVKNNRGQIVRIGGNKVLSIAGPCAVESLEQMMGVAARVSAAGAAMLRGGAFKPVSAGYFKKFIPFAIIRH